MKDLNANVINVSSSVHNRIVSNCTNLLFVKGLNATVINVNSIVHGQARVKAHKLRVHE